MSEERAGAIIGRNVRRLRDGGLWTREELAEKAGVSRQTIAHLELGTSGRPRRGTIEKLAEALDVPFETLLAEEATAPKAGAQPSPEQGRKLREVQERYSPIAEKLNDYCDDYEGLLDSGAIAQEDVDRFVRVAQTFDIGMTYVAGAEHFDLVDALGLDERADKQILSGVSEDAAGNAAMAQIFEHSQMRVALHRYYAVGRRLAEAVDYAEMAEKMGEEERKYAHA
jgi:transcriptional regulator with XRE-family HTH domain